jgi:cellulose synthase operon protein B
MFSMFVTRKIMMAGWAACAIFGTTAQAAVNPASVQAAASSPNPVAPVATAVPLATYANLSGPMRIAGDAASGRVELGVAAGRALAARRARQ